jgi:hypothetical protein
MATAHGDPYFIGGEERAAEVVGARDVHGKVKRGANGVTGVS